MNTFEQFPISPALLSTLTKMGFTNPTEVQQQAIPLLLSQEKIDIVALASTGTGKTAAFGIPLIEKADASKKTAQALILSPTRELAAQVADQLKKLGAAKNISTATIYGGSSYRSQIDAIKKGAQFIVATPGRLVDLLDQKLIKLSEIKTLVLDEADEMLSMGFQEDLETILKATHSDEAEASERAACQTWLFSATMNSQIKKLSQKFLEKPSVIELNKSKGVSATVEHIYYNVRIENKPEVLLRLLLLNPNFYGIIFCQTKLEVADLESFLMKKNYAVESLHGDKAQKDREWVMKRFRSGETKVVVATDVAARGIDVKNLTHVINYSLPRDIESYIHRVGRTGRAGEAGKALSLVSPDQVRILARIQQTTGVTLQKGQIPSPESIALFKIKQVRDELLQIDTESDSYEVAYNLVKETVLDEMLTDDGSKFESVEDLFARFLVKLDPELFKTEERSLDYIGGKIPRELLPKEERKFESRGEGRGRNAGEGRDRDRGGRGREGGRSSGGRFGGGRSEGRRDRGERSSERGEGRSEGRYARSDRGEGRSEKSERSFRSDRSERPRSKDKSDFRSEGRSSSDRPKRSDHPGIKRHRH